jgi:hypothetical protein
MNTKLVDHLGDLALTMEDLRQQFREAARFEVARAIGDALREFALESICGKARPHPCEPERSDWQDSWTDSPPTWHEIADSASGSSTGVPRASPVCRAGRLHGAIVVGLAAARWAFGRTRQPAPTIIAGAAVALIALAGGPAVEAMLGAWSAANDLLRDR